MLWATTEQRVRGWTSSPVRGSKRASRFVETCETAGAGKGVSSRSSSSKPAELTIVALGGLCRFEQNPNRIDLELGRRDPPSKEGREHLVEHLLRDGRIEAGIDVDGPEQRLDDVSDGLQVTREVREDIGAADP